MQKVSKMVVNSASFSLQIYYIFEVKVIIRKQLSGYFKKQKEL